MHKTLSFKNTEIDGCKFTSAKVRVPVRPKNDCEAQKWGGWLLGGLVSSSVGSVQYQKWTEGIAEKFAGHRPRFADKLSDYFKNAASPNDQTLDECDEYDGRDL